MKNLNQILKILRVSYKKYPIPIVTKYSMDGNPFLVLISTVLSLRTKDETTARATERLFDLAKTPEEMIKLPTEKIEKIIFPVGFYRTKAKNIKEICRILIENYNSIVPKAMDELLALPGVGRKTANLVLSLGYNDLNGLCVDVHVHVISNRLGWVKTKTPDDTEFTLRKVLPKKHWREINDLLVSYGQNTCITVSPFCTKCRIKSYCPRIGVERSR